MDDVSSHLHSLPFELLSYLIEHLSINDTRNLMKIVSSLEESQYKYIIMKRFPGLFKALDNNLNNINIYLYTCVSYTQLFSDLLDNVYPRDNYKQVLYEYTLYYGKYLGYDLTREKNVPNMLDLGNHYFHYERSNDLEIKFGYSKTKLQLSNGECFLWHHIDMNDIDWRDFHNRPLVIALIILVCKTNLVSLIQGPILDTELVISILKVEFSNDVINLGVLARVLTGYDYNHKHNYEKRRKIFLFIFQSEKVTATLIDKINFDSSMSILSYIIRNSGDYELCEIISRKPDFTVRRADIDTAISSKNLKILRLILNHKTAEQYM